MQIVIVEDNVRFAEDVAKMLELFFSGEGEIFFNEENYLERDFLLRGERPDIRYLEAVRFLEEVEKGDCCDLCLLDVEMPGMDGIALGEKIRTLNQEISIVYLTAHEKYAYPSYRVRADGYVLKDDYRNELPPLLLRILKKKQYNYYIIRKEGEGYRIRISDIVYLEKDGKYTLFQCMGQKRYQQRETLENIFQKFPKEQFAYIEKGIIVNLGHVMSFSEKKLILRDGTVLSVSRRTWPLVKEKLYVHWGIK